MLGLVIGRSREISSLGAFAAGLLGLFGLLYLLTVPQRPTGASRRTNREAVAASPRAALQLAAAVGRIGWRHASWIPLLLTAAVFAALVSLTFGILVGAVEILTGDPRHGLLWLAVGVAALALLKLFMRVAFGVKN